MSRAENVPKLRFEEFKDAPEWEEKKLGDVCEFSKGKDVKEKIFDKEGKKFIGYGDLYTKYGAVTKSTITKISKGLFYNQVISRGNELLLPSSGESELEMNSCTALLESGVIIGSDINIVTSEVISIVFLSFYIRNNSIKIAKLSQGISVIHLYNKELKLMPINLPTLPEQQAIADFLTLLDERIQTQTELIDKLKEQKRGYLQKLFPKNGKNIPELRFEEFKDAPEWEEKKLGDVCEYQNGTSLEKYFNNKKGLKVISIGNYSINGKYVDNNTYIDILDNKTKKYVLNKDDLTMVLNDKTQTAEILGKVLYIEDDNKYIFNQRTMRISATSEVYIKYLYSLLNSKYVHSQIIKLAKGGTQIYINTNDVLMLHLPLPTLPEQQAISGFLTLLDEEIELESGILEQYKQEKQGYLQGLFV